MLKTLGGDRLGTGKKMKVHLHGYERSTHDMGYIWRSTMSAGTLVPFMSEVALPGDTFDIDLDCDIKTHPTIGPLFGSYKVQLDVFQAPIRLYNSLLHNNALGIGLNMAQVKLPTLEMNIQRPTSFASIGDLDNSQVNPSCILSYLGIRGLGYIPPDNVSATVGRAYNAIPLLAYWEIYKNYYSNKQEEIGAVIHTEIAANTETVDAIDIAGQSVDQAPATVNVVIHYGDQIEISYTGATPIPSQIIFSTSEGDYSGDQIAVGFTQGAPDSIVGQISRNNITVYNWRYRENTDPNNGKPQVVTFPLVNIDEMRKEILAFSSTSSPFTIQNADPDLEPYKWLPGDPLGTTPQSILSSQEGLGLKTYQSDLFNNWLQTEWIDGTGGISEVTSIDTSGGSFTIDTLNLAKKVYNMLNRIAVSGGTYDDWMDAVYDHDRYQRCESPMYMGGLSKELVFQEVVSNSESGGQPLGTLAGRGVMTNKHKGGKIVVRVDEPSYIMGIISLTPRLDYSQGNKWDTGLKTLNDLHKPALDEIGFQDLTTPQMAWWDSYWDGTAWVVKSAGKQPAWINYMTNVNQTRGNFAVASNEMFMTLNRRYEAEEIAADGGLQIKDLTTYIDPSKYNNIFAETAIDSQNFWAQIAVDITARRKMSAKIMPNL